MANLRVFVKWSQGTRFELSKSFEWLGIGCKE